MRASRRVASSPSEYEKDTAAINVALNRLYGAAVSQVDEIVSELQESDRAAIAVFCNARAHECHRTGNRRKVQSRPACSSGWINGRRHSAL
jgi:hypothetical protein